MCDHCELKGKTPRMASEIVAIVNPASAGGRTPAAFGRALPFMPQGVSVMCTKTPEHATELTAEALRAGATTIVAVGGDGTLNEVVNGFFADDQRISPDARLAWIPSGTGIDFRRSLLIPEYGYKAADVLTSGQPRMIDLMRVSYTKRNGTTAVRYGINVTSLGISGVVADRANRTTKPLGGAAAYWTALAQTIWKYSGKMVTVRIDDEPAMQGKITMVAIGNGQFHGNGMWICPGASIDDGMLDITVVGDLTTVGILRYIWPLYRGGIYSQEKVKSFHGKRITVESSEPALIEIDGEAVGRLPMEISVVPSAIRMLT